MLDFYSALAFNTGQNIRRIPVGDSALLCKGSDYILLLFFFFKISLQGKRFS